MPFYTVERQFFDNSFFKQDLEPKTVSKAETSATVEMTIKFDHEKNEKRRGRPRKQ